MSQESDPRRAIRTARCTELAVSGVITLSGVHPPQAWAARQLGAGLLEGTRSLVVAVGSEEGQA